MENKRILLIIALSLVLLTTVYIVGVSTGKKKKSVELQKLPHEKKWGKELTKAESIFIDKLATALDQDITSWAVSWGTKPRNCNAYTVLSTTTDVITVGTYNQYNEKFADEDSTLTKDIADESFAFTGGCSDDIKVAVLSKLKRLGLN